MQVSAKITLWRLRLQSPLLAGGLWLLTIAPIAAQTKLPGAVQVDSVLVTLIEQVSVPAQEKGLLAKVEVREGDLGAEGDLLAQIDDSEARLTLDRARIELDIALKQSKNDVAVRFAKKAWELAKTEVKRANESIVKFSKSVSQSEIDQLRLTADKAELEIEQAQQELDVAALTAALKKSELDFAAHNVSRRKIAAPIAGVVVEVRRHRGEFIESGDAVFRILRVDRLRAEGFVGAKSLSGSPIGSRVLLTFDLAGNRLEVPGSLVFVSPEVNPVSGQIRVWAEFDNPKLQLRPGLQASMVIQPGVLK